MLLKNSTGCKSRFLPPRRFEPVGFGPNSRRLCRCGCGKEVPAYRQTFASWQCVDRFRIAKEPAYMRERVYEQAQGVCALCGANCDELWSNLQEAKTAPERKLALLRCGLTEKEAAKRSNCWDADHITAVADGGGSCGLDNLRLICCRCHKERTREQNRNRRRR